MLTNNKTKLRLFSGLLFAAVLMQPIGFSIQKVSWFDLFKRTASVDDVRGWTKIQSKEGNCQAHFPKEPEHLSQKMKMQHDNIELQYDVFVADHDRKAVFMMLVARYPSEVSEDNGKKNLEHFLNTILNQNPNNRLIFADLVTVQEKHQGLDFFIRTNRVYFKGRAVQANNCLYLLAMECEVNNYNEKHFNYFIEKFQIK